MLGEQTFSFLVFAIGNLFLFVGFGLAFLPPKLQHWRFGIILGLLLSLSLILGLRRWDVGIDTPKYVQAFESQKIYIYHQLEIYEPLYILGGLLLKFLLREYNLFLLAVPLIQGLFLLSAYRVLLPERLYPFALALYMGCFVFWLSNISMLRQGITIASCFFAYSLLIQGKRLPALLLALASSLVHFSAGIFPAVYGLYRGYQWCLRKHPKIFGFVVALVLAGLFYPGSLFYELLKLVVDMFFSLTAHPYLEKIQWYLTWSKLTPWNLKHVYFLILGLFLFATPFFHREDLLRELYLFLLTGLTVILLCKYDEMVADRMFMYFVPAIPALILRLTQTIFPRPADQKLLLVLILLGGLVWFNVKLFLLQYPGWFISPYPAVR